jgi:hypothetical protein
LQSKQWWEAQEKAAKEQEPTNNPDNPNAADSADTGTEEEVA